MSRVQAVLLTFFLSFVAVPNCFAEFPGWQGIRVIEQDGRPYHLRAGDIDGDGRHELLVVNGRSSRIDIYNWLSPEESKEQLPVDPDEPNDLPMATDMKHEELQLEHIPKDALLKDLDGDQTTELIVLTSPPNQVIVFQRDKSGQWTKQYAIDLLEGGLNSRRESLLYRSLGKDTQELLVSLDNGIQQIQLKPGGKARWMTPREQRNREHWWLADLNGDGLQDLVEQTRESNESLRWYSCLPNGMLSPAANLLDRSVDDAEVLSIADKTQVIVKDGNARDLLRRYELSQGEESPFGLQRPLALPAGKKVAWCGILQGDRRSLVMADPEGPRLLSHILDESGWQSQQAYPAITNVRALAPLPGKPGTLLIWSKDSADLRVSRWEGERFTYPQPYLQSADVEDRKILALNVTGSTTWWVQRAAKNLDLYVATKADEEPRRIRFDGVGAKADQVLWLGSDRILLKERHARELKLVELVDGKSKVSSPTHLKKATLGQFKLVAVGNEIRLCKLTDGVLQWIGDDLQSKEQVMLSQGQQLSDYVAVDAQHGWALQQGSPYIHQVAIDDTGLSTSTARHKVVEGSALMNDDVLGLLLIAHDRVIPLGKGAPWELALIDLIDKRVARSGGIKETNFHRMDTIDIDGDGYSELILYDDSKHRMMALSAEEGELQPKISWPVFDDQVYPYGDGSEGQVREPRALLAADFDGDQHQDLALLCHDRLLIYLARDKK